MLLVVDGQVHDYYSYLNDLPQLQAWLQGGYVISNPASGDGEAADEDFTAEELAAMEKEIAGGEGDDEGEDVDFDDESQQEDGKEGEAKKEL